MITAASLMQSDPQSVDPGMPITKLERLFLSSGFGGFAGQHRPQCFFPALPISRTHPFGAQGRRCVEPYFYRIERPAQGHPSRHPSF